MSTEEKSSPYSKHSSEDSKLTSDTEKEEINSSINFLLDVTRKLAKIAEEKNKAKSDSISN